MIWRDFSQEDICEEMLRTAVILLQSRGGGVVHDKLLQKGFRLSVSGGSFPPRPPARFAMPAARGKTSLNARDW